VTRADYASRNKWIILEESAYAQRIGFMSVSSHDIHIVTPRYGESVSAVQALYRSVS
jgi:hypothetical protein